RLSGWHGNGAQAFDEMFTRTVPHVARYQALLAAVLQHAMEANKELLINARRDLLVTAWAALAAIDDLRRFHYTPTRLRHRGRRGKPRAAGVPKCLRGTGTHRPGRPSRWKPVQFRTAVVTAATTISGPPVRRDFGGRRGAAVL